MPRTWLRPVACLSLAAYLFANTAAGSALSIHLQKTDSCRDENAAAVSTDPEPTDPAPPRCKHCAKFRRQAPPEQHTEGPECCSEESSHPESPQEPADSSCPCCPKGPPCPVPGGCAICNIAKVPCLATALLALLPPLCAGASLIESPPLYLPPSGDELIRPPRS